MIGVSGIRREVFGAILTAFPPMVVINIIGLALFVFIILEAGSRDRPRP